MKKLLSSIFVTILMLAIICLSSCNGDIEETSNESTTNTETMVVTIDKIESSSGAYVEGDSFDPKSVFVFSKIEGQSESKEKVKGLMESENYNKDSEIQLYESYMMIDNQSVQPQKELTITIPKSLVSMEDGKGYLLFQIVDDKAERIDYSETGDSWQFSVSHLSVFVIVEEYKEHIHNYGKLHAEVKPTLFCEGTIAYYKCEDCGMYFDKDKNVVDDIVIGRKVIELTLVVNGRNTADFVCTRYEDDLIEWKTDIVSFSKNELLSVVDKNNDLIEYEFIPDTNSNITSSCTTHNKADAEVVITCTPEGMLLSVGGYREEVVYLRISRGDEVINYNMTYLENTSDEDLSCYYCGYYYFLAGDSLRIIDNINDTTYGFDNISEELYWNDFTCERGDDNSIIIKKDVKMGIGVYPGQQEVYYRNIFTPNNGKKYHLEIRHSSETSDMFNEVFEVNDDIYQLLTFLFDQLSIENIEENLEFLKDKNLSVYMTVVKLSIDSEIRIYDESNKKYISSEHLIEYLDDDKNVQISGNYIKLNDQGVYIIIYLPFVDSIYIMNGNSYTIMEPTLVKNTTVVNTNMKSMTVSEEDENIYEELNVYLTPKDYFVVCYNLYPYTSVESGRTLILNYGDFYKVDISGRYNIRFNKLTQKFSIELVAYDTNPIVASFTLVYVRSLPVTEIPYYTQRIDMIDDGDSYRCTVTLYGDDYLVFLDKNGNIIDDLKYTSLDFPNIVRVSNDQLYCRKGSNIPYNGIKIVITINKTTHRVTSQYARSS